MSSRRSLILAAAVLVGALAAYALYVYVDGIEERANDDVERVEVFKIVEDIPKGTFGNDAFDQGLIKADQIAKEFRPASAIESPEQISGLVAISDLAANQVVVGNQFVDQAAALSTFSGLLEDNEVAITVSVDQIRGVAGLLVPSDYVNLLVTSESVAGAEGAPPPVVFGQPASVLYQKVQILAVGQTRTLEPGETAVTNEDGSAVDAGSSGLITFAVPLAAARQIASVPGAQFYLTLVAADYVPAPAPPLDPGAPLPGENGAQLTPYGPAGRPE